MQDVIVIGGSYAGMAAALQLLRARRKVLVVDAGQRRNRFARRAHGFLGQDGVDPTVIWSQAREQLLRYPTLNWVPGSAVALQGQRDDFTVTLEGGQSHLARRVLLATGVTDTLPDVPGLAERWGQSVFHCPYCHGYELNQGRIGVIATGPMSVHQAAMLPEWGETTFLAQGLVLDPDQRADLQARGVTVEEVPIRQLTAAADVVLQDGRTLPFAGLFTASVTRPAGPLAETCALVETPMGLQFRTSDARETSRPGLYACGDAARAPHSVSLAVADGAWAGAQIHRSLIWPD